MATVSPPVDAVPLPSEAQDFQLYESIVSNALRDSPLPKLLNQWLCEYKGLLRLLLHGESDHDYVLSVRVLLSVIQHSNGFDRDALDKPGPISAVALRSMLRAPVLMWNVEHELWLHAVTNFFNELSSLTSEDEVLKLASEWVSAQNEMFHRLEIMCGKKMCGEVGPALLEAESSGCRSLNYESPSSLPSSSLTRTDASWSRQSVLERDVSSSQRVPSWQRPSRSDASHVTSVSPKSAPRAPGSPGSHCSDMRLGPPRPNGQLPPSVMQLYYQYDTLAQQSSLSSGLLHLVKKLRNTFVQEYSIRTLPLEKESVALASLKPHRRQWLTPSFVLRELLKATDGPQRHTELAAELSHALAFHIKKQYVTFFLEGHKLGRRSYYLFEDAQRWTEAVAHMLSEDPDTAPCAAYPPPKTRALVNEPHEEDNIDFELALSRLPADKQPLYRNYKAHLDASGVTGRNAVIVDRFLKHIVDGYYSRPATLSIPSQARGLGAAKQQLLSREYLMAELYDAVTKVTLHPTNEAADAVEELSLGAACHAINQFHAILVLPKKVGRKRHFLFEDIKIWLRVSCTVLQAMFSESTPKAVDLESVSTNFHDAGAFFFDEDQLSSLRGRSGSSSHARTVGKTAFYSLD